MSQTGVVGGEVPCRGVSWHRPVQNKKKTNKKKEINFLVLKDFSSGDVDVWNLSFLKIKISVFENLTVVKELKRKMLSRE